jgi:hypothetical protein
MRWTFPCGKVKPSLISGNLAADALAIKANGTSNRTSCADFQFFPTSNIRANARIPSLLEDNLRDGGPPR